MHFSRYGFRKISHWQIATGHPLNNRTFAIGKRKQNDAVAQRLLLTLGDIVDPIQATYR